MVVSFLFFLTIQLNSLNLNFVFSIALTITSMIPVLANCLSSRNIKQDNCFIHATRAEVRVVPRALGIKHFITMAMVCLEQ